LAVRYERPTDAERTDIWRRLFDKLEQDQRRDAEALLDVQQWNK
jgi:hypothetical protein